MLSISGGGLATFVGGTIEVGFSSPAAAPNFFIGVFDAGSQGLWDDPTVDLQFQVCADPLNDGTGTTCSAPFLSTSAPPALAENDWWDLSFPNQAAAQATPGADFFYFLRITPVGAPAPGSLNGIKVRTLGTFSLTGQTIQFIAKANTIPELQIIGGFPCGSPTNYDGIWEFEFNVKPNTFALELWDGDFDFGTVAGPDKDTDDPNTPPTNVCVDPDPINPPNCTNPNVPLWAQGGSAKPEGVADDGNGPGVGSPEDDSPFCVFRRSPSVIYRFIPPSGGPPGGYLNSNPSGTSEWEKFLISTKAGDNPDYLVASIPAGKWKLRIEGMDVFNQFALHFNKSLEPTIPGNAQGCSPGYWKQSQHFDSYPVGVTPNSLFTSVGFENAFPNKTLVQVLSTGGGGLTALGRIIVGAYLNAATIPNFPFTAQQVVNDFNAVFPGGDYEKLKSKYENLQDPCPFN